MNALITIVHATTSIHRSCASDGNIGCLESHFKPTKIPIENRNCQAKGLNPPQRLVNGAMNSEKTCDTTQMSALMPSVNTQCRSPAIKKAGTLTSVNTMYNTKMSDNGGGEMSKRTDDIVGSCCGLPKDPASTS